MIVSALSIKSNVGRFPSILASSSSMASLEFLRQVSVSAQV